MRKIIILSLLSCVVATVQAKEYPIKATMIKPVMQNSEYQLENFEGNNFLGTLTCPNGAKPKIYNSKSVYIPEKEMWSPKDLIRYSILGDVVSKLIETDSVFLGDNTSWPIVVGAEVAKEGIIKYSEKNNVDPDKKANALNVTAGVSTGTSIANLMIAAGATNPIGIAIGIVGGTIVYNESNKQYELKKLNAGKTKVITIMQHPVDTEKVYACE